MPKEWWDPKWIKDNIQPKLDSSTVVNSEKEKPVRKVGPETSPLVIRSQCLLIHPSIWPQRQAMSESRAIVLERLQKLLIGFEQVRRRENSTYLSLIVKHRQTIDTLGDYLCDRNGKRSFTFDGNRVAGHDLTHVLCLPVACAR